MLPLVMVLTTGTVLTADDDSDPPPLLLLPAPAEVELAETAVATEDKEEVSLDKRVVEPMVVSLAVVETTGTVVTAEADDEVSEGDPVPVPVAPTSEEKILRAARLVEGVPSAEAEDSADWSLGQSLFFVLVWLEVRRERWARAKRERRRGGGG